MTKLTLRESDAPCWHLSRRCTLLRFHLTCKEIPKGYAETGKTSFRTEAWGRTSQEYFDFANVCEMPWQRSMARSFVSKKRDSTVAGSTLGQYKDTQGSVASRVTGMFTRLRRLRKLYTIKNFIVGVYSAYRVHYARYSRPQRAGFDHVRWRQRLARCRWMTRHCKQIAAKFSENQKHSLKAFKSDLGVLGYYVRALKHVYLAAMDESAMTTVVKGTLGLLRSCILSRKTADRPCRLLQNGM